MTGAGFHPRPESTSTPLSADTRPDRDSPGVIRRALLAWYDAHARDLPWRRTDDPYAVWVSEVMLQQTRVETVVPYWERWMESYPTVQTLAAADLDDVLKAWEGLGYYRRARFLHRAAGMVRDRHDGALPSEVSELKELPGIGEYTAGAVASIAFQEPVPAVDGNVRRVLARLFDLPEPTPAELRDRARALVDPERPGDFNQALMELGATVCTPSSPDCGACPVEQACLARARGTMDARPLPRDRKPVPEVEVGVAVPVRRVGVDGELLTFLVRRPEDGLLGGLWEFPGAEMKEGEGARGAAVRAAREHGVELDAGPIADRGNDPPESSPPEAPPSADALALPPVRHAYSHFRATYHGVLCVVDADPDVLPRGGEAGPGEPAAGSTGDPAGDDATTSRWIALADLDELALPVAQRKIADAAREALS